MAFPHDAQNHRRAGPTTSSYNHGDSPAPTTAKGRHMNWNLYGSVIAFTAIVLFAILIARYR